MSVLAPAQMASLLSGRIAQVQLAVASTDLTTSSTSFSDVLSITLTTAVSRLLIFAPMTLQAQALVAIGTVALFLDGAQISGSAGGVSILSAVGMTPIALETVTAGEHTVKVRWKAGTAGTLALNALTTPDLHGARLLVIEILQ